jgi:antirestriction protein ArdC
VSGGGWLTYKQAQALGGQVRRGEQGVKGVYYTSWSKKKASAGGGEDDEVDKKIPVLKGFTLFHVSQVDGLPEADLHLVDADDEVDTSGGDFTPAPDLVRLREIELTRLVVGGDTAAYVPAHDTIMMPPPARFEHGADWWRVYLHELVHATGHPSRLDRAQSTRFGSRTYAFEELVAELGAALLSHTFGVSVGQAPGELASEHARDHAAYISSWITCLKADSGALFDAWALALNACDWIELELANAAFAAHISENAVA